MAEVEHRISEIMKKKRAAERLQGKLTTSNLEKRINNVANFADAVNKEKLEQQELLESIHEGIKAREAEVEASLENNTNHFVKLAADEAERLLNGNTEPAPTGQPLPTEPGAPDSIQDLQRRSAENLKIEAAANATKAEAAAKKAASEKAEREKKPLFKAEIGLPPSVMEDVVSIVPVVAVPAPVPHVDVVPVVPLHVEAAGNLIPIEIAN